MYGTGSYNKERHSQILLARMSRERSLLTNPNRGSIQALYITDRYSLYEPVEMEITRRLKRGEASRVLELGAGEGIVSYCLGKNFKGNEKVDITMTSLTPVDQHQKVKAEGVKVYTGVLAERLPRHWEGSFDIVATDSVIGWTDIPESLMEIRRVLASGGVWIGLESWVASSWERTSTVKKDIQKEMKKLGMKNSAKWWDQMLWFLDNEDVYQFGYEKKQTH